MYKKVCYNRITKTCFEYNKEGGNNMGKIYDAITNTKLIINKIQPEPL
mgnify:FL=1